VEILPKLPHKLVEIPPKLPHKLVEIPPSYKDLKGEKYEIIFHISLLLFSRMPDFFVPLQQNKEIKA